MTTTDARLTADDLAAIERRLMRATPGPWTVRHRHVMMTPDDDEAAGLGLEIEGPEEAWGSGQFHRAADADLIAHAPTDLAALLAEVRRLLELSSAALDAYDNNGEWEENRGGTERHYAEGEYVSDECAFGCGGRFTYEVTGHTSDCPYRRMREAIPLKEASTTASHQAAAARADCEESHESR